MTKRPVIKDLKGEQKEEALLTKRQRMDESPNSTPEHDPVLTAAAPTTKHNSVGSSKGNPETNLYIDKQPYKRVKRDTDSASIQHSA